MASFEFQNGRKNLRTRLRRMRTAMIENRSLERTAKDTSTEFNPVRGDPCSRWVVGEGH
jgi:hypothetical protein